MAVISPACRHGTGQCADAIAWPGDASGIIADLHGDAPLTPGFVFERLVDGLAEDLAE